MRSVQETGVRLVSESQKIWIIITFVPSQDHRVVDLAHLAECALSMREARGSIPLVYTFFAGAKEMR